jgi:DNA-3-methyladenine glycosylase II
MRKAILHLKKADPVLRRLIETIGPYSIEYRPPEFETLVRSIVFQQLSGKVARVIYDRLESCVPNGRLSPESILKLPPRKMRGIGLSRQKLTYIRDLASRTRCGEVDFTGLPAASDEEVIFALTQVKGIGVWTAQMFLIFALARPDVLPTGDLGVRKAMQNAYGLPELPKPSTMEELAAPWRPYCSVACWYLWRSLDGIAGI